MQTYAENKTFLGKDDHYNIGFGRGKDSLTLNASLISKKKYD